MRGLCHGCYTSGAVVVPDKGNILCKVCIDKKNAKN